MKVFFRILLCLILFGVVNAKESLSAIDGDWHIFGGYVECAQSLTEEDFDSCLKVYASGQIPASNRCFEVSPSPDVIKSISIPGDYYVKSVVSRIKKIADPVVYFSSRDRVDVFMSIDFLTASSEIHERQIAVTYLSEQGVWKVNQFIVNCRDCQLEQLSEILEMEYSEICPPVD